MFQNLFFVLFIYVWYDFYKKRIKKNMIKQDNQFDSFVKLILRLDLANSSIAVSVFNFWAVFLLVGRKKAERKNVEREKRRK